MLTINGWLNGLTALLIVVFSAIFGILMLIKSLRTEQTTVLMYGALMGLFAGLLWLGPATDFIMILLTENNLDNQFGLYGLLSYMWVGPASITAISLGAEVTAPKLKKIIIPIILIIAVLFEFYLFVFTMDLFDFHYPATPGENLIDSTFVTLSPGFILVAIIIGLVLIFCGVGAFRIAAKSTGNIRTRFLMLGTSFVLFCGVAIADALLNPGVLLFIARFGMIACAFFIYYGVKD